MPLTQHCFDTALHGPCRLFFTECLPNARSAQHDSRTRMPLVTICRPRKACSSVERRLRCALAPERLAAERPRANAIRDRGGRDAKGWLQRAGDPGALLAERGPPAARGAADAQRAARRRSAAARARRRAASAAAPRPCRSAAGQPRAAHRRRRRRGRRQVPPAAAEKVAGVANVGGGPRRGGPLPRRRRPHLARLDVRARGRRRGPRVSRGGQRGGAPRARVFRGARPRRAAHAAQTGPHAHDAGARAPPPRLALLDSDERRARCHDCTPGRLRPFHRDVASAC